MTRRRLTVVLVVSSLMVVPWLADAAVDDRAVTISTVADISIKRQAIIDFIWGPEGFPSSAMPSSVTLNAQSPVSGLSNLSRVDKLAIGMDAGQEGLAYHFIPQRQNRRLVVVHNGHACSFEDDAGFTDGGFGFHRTINGLLTDGYSVLAVYMPFLNHLNCGYEVASHDDLFNDPQYAPSSGSPLQYFLEPVAISLNYLRTSAAADGFPVYQDFSMVGFSGGGWTTTVYAAIDPLISVSVPVAGRMPLYSAPYGDTEQTLDAFYRIAGYPDLYLLGSYGNGRKQVWILNRRDNCCFGDHPDLYQDPAGRTWEQVVRAYEYDVRLALHNFGSTGAFRLEIDEAATAHTISWNSVVNQILAELNDGRRYIGASSSENAFVRGPSGTLWHYGPAGWVHTGCPMVGAAAVVEGAVNLLDVFYRDEGNRLMHAFTNGAGWSCVPVSGIIISDPAVVSTAPGSYDVVAFGPSYCLYRWHGTASGIEPYQRLPCGIGLGTPSVVSPGPNQLSVFFRGFDRALHHAYFTGGGPWQLEVIGGIMLDFPTAKAMPDGSLRAYVRGLSGQLWEAQAPHQGGVWTWSSISAQVALNANVTFPVAAATPVTWTAAATGGASPYSFKFWVDDGSTWSVGQDWSSASTWTWTPINPGTYSVQVWTRNTGSSADYDAWRSAGPVSVGPAALAVTALTSNPPGPVWTNTMVTWSAAASGGTAPYSYQFWLFNGTSWSIGQDWSSSNTWSWTPLVPRTYTVQVWARNAGSSAAFDAWRGSAPFVVNGPQPLSVTSLTPTQAFPLPAGTPVNLVAAASGGTGPYTYKFWIHNGTNWTLGRDWGPSNSITWLPASPGTYSFQVWARNTGSSADYDAFGGFGPYNVTAPADLTAVSLLSDRVFPVAAGTPVTWTALARGGTGPYTYRFLVFNGSSWSIAQDWGPSSTWTWVSPVAGSYQFQVWVRNAGSINTYDAWVGAGPAAIGPSAPLSITSFSASALPAVGIPTLLTAVAQGGLGPYSYKFWVYDGSAWSVGQDWSSASTFSWIPPAIGSYSFQVWVRNVGSLADLDAWRGLGPLSADPDKLQLDVYVTGLALPIGLVQDPTTPSLQYVIEQGGTIRVIQDGVLLPTPFLNISSSISAGGERGLLGLAFAPSYQASRNFFVYFTNPQGNPVVARFKRSAGNPLVADPASRFDLRWGGPTGQRFIVHPFSNHNGGHLAFGPDGYLYIASGDGGGANDTENYGQNPDSLLGKLLRIDVDVSDGDQEGYVVPADNPFVDNDPIAALPEIWAFGVRNPWKFSFDSPVLGGTGAMFIGDVGQGNWEEIDYQPPGVGGRNYGWRVREGQHPTPGVPFTLPAYEPLVDPIFEYSHAVGSSITGGVVYRGFALQPFYRGRYFYADFVQGKLFSIGTAAAGGGEVVATAPLEHTTEIGGSGVTGLVSAFGQDAFGEIYVVSYSRGMILRLN